MNLVRHSKYRHVYGKVATRDMSFDDIRFTNTPIDSNLIAVSKKFVAFIEASMGGGSFTVVPITNFGRISRNTPRVIGHNAEVLDIAFSPFSDVIIASASADSKVRIWEIPEEGLISDLYVPLVELVSHDRKVTIVCWHPTALNVLVSGGLDPWISLWDVSTGTELSRVNLEDGISHCSFNYNGSLMAAILRNKELIVFDPRIDCIEKSVLPHTGTRPARCVFVNGNRIFTCGFEKGTARTLALWNADDLSQPICKINFDQNRGHVTLHYEPEHEVVFVAGRGEGFISIFELTNDEPYIHYLTSHQSSNSPQKALGILPKQCCDYMHCEIVRGYRGLNNGFCEIVSFIVPRKSTNFQSDLFSEIRSGVPSMTASEYMMGMNSDPIMISLDPKKPKNVPSNHQKSCNSSTIEEKVQVQSSEVNIVTTEQQSSKSLHHQPSNEETLDENIQKLESTNLEPQKLDSTNHESQKMESTNLIVIDSINSTTQPPETDPILVEKSEETSNEVVEESQIATLSVDENCRSIPGTNENIKEELTPITANDSKEPLPVGVKDFEDIKSLLNTLISKFDSLSSRVDMIERKLEYSTISLNDAEIEPVNDNHQPSNEETIDENIQKFESTDLEPQKLDSTNHESEKMDSINLDSQKMESTNPIVIESIDSTTQPPETNS